MSVAPVERGLLISANGAREVITPGDASCMRLTGGMERFLIYRLFNSLYSLLVLNGKHLNLVAPYVSVHLGQGVAAVVLYNAVWMNIFFFPL